MKEYVGVVLVVAAILLAGYLVVHRDPSPKCPDISSPQ